jgi:hypothetical protein
MSPNPGTSPAGGPPVPDEAPTMPLMTDASVRPEGMPDPADFESVDSAGGNRFANQGTVLLVLILAIATGTIFVMRQGQKDRGPSASDATAEAEVATALAKLSEAGKLGPDDPLLPANLKGLVDTKSILSAFSRDHVQKQVPVEFLRKNPFSMPVAEPEPGNIIAPVAEGARPDATNEKLKLEFGDLVLQSVMGGARPIAIINQKMLQIGQKIGSFTVKSIAGTSVELESQGWTFMLKMDTKIEPDTPANSTPRPAPRRN